MLDNFIDLVFMYYSIYLFIFIYIQFFFATLKVYRPRANKSSEEKKTCLSPDPFKRTVEEVEAMEVQFSVTVLLFLSFQRYA